VVLYSNIRVSIAGIFKDGEFGIAEVKEIVEGLDTKELALEKIRQKRKALETGTIGLRQKRKK